MAAAAATIPSYQRVEPGSVNIPVADFSTIKTAAEPKDIDTATEEWVTSFNKVIQSSDYSALSQLFLPQAFWRDHLCLSWE